MEKIAVRGAEVVNDRGDAVDGRGLRFQIAGDIRGLALLGGLELFLQALLVGQQRFDFLFQLADGRIHFAGQGFEQAQLLGRLAVGFQAGDGFDPADARGDGALADDAEEANLTGGAGVRAAAKFHRIAV